MNNFESAVMKRTIEIAKSSMDHSDNRFYLAAVGTNNNTIICHSNNLMGKSHPTQARHARNAGNPHAIFLHAEIGCIIRGKGYIDTLFVARIYRDGTLGLAKPCPICMLAIKEKESGIKKVWYTINNNEYGFIKI